ncbi:DEAD/DEAH box helicase family protein [Candidatus Spongiihabitans sp.]|uniref:DEAD/DEAH box helicase family protein n=1 Tax=Candidatus Spongiihabitans sp. TaxID=3101308 RepID=UPI003C7B308D
MTSPILENIAQSSNYGDLPEVWWVPEMERFSSQKTLYDYQTDALKNAARALFLYYGKEHDWTTDEPPKTNDQRKHSFAELYGNSGIAEVKKFGSVADEKAQNENQVFRILSDVITPEGDCIPYRHLINRMCFWMATGSGKTLVMVKLLEYLHHLQQHREIPPHKVLMLAPSDHLIRQIHRTIDEFNESGGLQIDLMPLRHVGREPYQSRLGDALTVYYHRSDNISDVQKDALTDYRVYENGGKWFILLDEAHKGGKEDSKRQAYYAVMARAGFLFNFSATFTDDEDIVTTVKKYNLEEFIKSGYGKSIYLNEEEYAAFKNRGQEISHDERRKIVLKSLITLAYVSIRIKQLRHDTDLENLYHLPLMLTLVNSVNTAVENEGNDLWAFFQTLREIATGEIDESFFGESKTGLIQDWSNARLLFGEDGGGIIGTDETSITVMKVADLRAEVFLSRRKGALQFIRSGDNKELAFQMKNAEQPFALIRIGDTSKWRNELLEGYEETTALQDKSFFDGLEKSSITILMGSRSFFESWDSNRPNVINFINIGGKDAKKFVVQSVGRGVRIEPLKDKRRRLARLGLTGKEKQAMERCHDQVQPAETLFLFATNRSAVKAVLAGLQTEKESVFQKLKGFETATIPKIGNKAMPLLIPEYREVQGDPTRARFSMSGETRQRFKAWLGKTSDSVLAVRDGLEMPQIAALRSMVEPTGNIQTESEKNYAMLPFLQKRLVAHLSHTAKVSDGVRPLDAEDIVHFREIQVSSEYFQELQKIIPRVKHGKITDGEIPGLAEQLRQGEITREKFDHLISGQTAMDFHQLKIKKLLGHYYLPVILGDETANYIQHIIKVESEISLLNALEEWMGENEVPWDAWMFSKIDESLDKVHIPYYDESKNEYRRFLPDFVFWMCRGNEYRIVFVDPKGTEHASAYRKIDGYQKLFTGVSGVRLFKHAAKWQVSVNLFLYNPQSVPAEAYKDYWIDHPAPIFETA